MISKKQNGTHRKNFADKQQDEYIQQLKTGKAPIDAQLPQESSKWNYSICGIV